MNCYTIVATGTIKGNQFSLIDFQHISHMTITSNNPDVYANAFPNSLTGKTRDWYMTLPMKTIDTYQQTADTFVAKFATAIQRRQNERILMDIK
ncbi:hypothetical protein LIER_39534 [Lithospermum erythrorhizon]|uniref:Retrotransposon gag domain-containing protein n=1 Tax=Lithospermum erythrorhizon TaxID=34254 RepID=A0AAV3QIQ4_LITER